MKATNRILQNYMKCGVSAPLTDYIREIKLFAGVKPGEEPTEHFSDTYRFVKQRMEYLARAEVTKDL
jgi:hypothetical protein